MIQQEKEHLGFSEQDQVAIVRIDMLTADERGKMGYNDDDEGPPPVFTIRVPAFRSQYDRSRNW